MISLIILLLTIAGKQTNVSLVATFYINGLYVLGLVPPRADPRLLPHPSPNPGLLHVEIRKLYPPREQRMGVEWGSLGRHFLVLPSCDFGRNGSPQSLY